MSNTKLSTKEQKDVADFVNTLKEIVRDRQRTNCSMKMNIIPFIPSKKTDNVKREICKCFKGVFKITFKPDGKVGIKDIRAVLRKLY